MKLICTALLLGLLCACSPKPDPNVIAKWTTIDFVANVEDFSPLSLTHKGQFALPELEFKEQGKTSVPVFTWTEGFIHNSADNTDAKYLIKTIDGETYLFMEWMSGDVTIRGMKPKYYVLKKEA